MKNYKVGSIVLATDQGLGYLARDFYNNGIIDKVFIKQHSSRTNHPEWYKDDVVSGIDELIEQCDTLLFFEEVFDWSTIIKARNKNKKTVLMPMYECTRNPLPYFPDVIITPSELDQQYYPTGVRINVPVTVKWRLRERARVFVHNAGNGGLGGRNGTKDVLDAMQYVKSPIRLIVRSQVPIQQTNDPRIEYRIGQFDDIWDEGDVFIFPERFNGLSLPLQEALASGMLVMAGDRFPNNTYLPTAPLIPVDHYVKERISVEFDSARFNSKEIARTIDTWYDADIKEYSLLGRDFLQNNSWEKLKEQYETVLLPL